MKSVCDPTKLVANPEVSVSLLTYNQQDTIGRALDSILAQETTFDYEIIVGDDCSDDGTQEILYDYQARYPDKIQLVLHPRRYKNEVPGRTNNMTNLSNCRGKYTAMLDGDDYWLGTDKLQSQYDIMESDADLVMAAHDTQVNFFDHNDELISTKLNCERCPHKLTTGKYDRSEFFKGVENRIHVSSLFFRTRTFKYFPSNFRDVVGADEYIMQLLAASGKIYYSRDVKSAYQKHSKGFTANPAFYNIDMLLQRLNDYDIFASLYEDTAIKSAYRRGKSRMVWKIFRYCRKNKRSILKTVPHLHKMLTYDLAAYLLSRK